MSARPPQADHVKNVFSSHMKAVALALLGEPNERLTKPNELRYGTRGSLCIDLEAGVWHDRENNVGGGVLDLIERETGFAGRAAIEWMASAGIRSADENAPAVKPRIVKTYDYIDEHGVVQFQVCRYEPKDFRQRRPDASKREGWNWSVKGARHVPYRLPQILAKQNDVVFVVEGEKDADALAAIGLTATCNAGGANKWRNELTSFFKNRHVILLPDNDHAGRAHVAMIADKLQGLAASVRVLDLSKHWPTMPMKSDISDWLMQGHTASELLQLADNAPIAEVRREVVPAKDNSAGVREILDGEISEDMIALVFEHRYRDMLRYCHTAGKWYAWTGARWQQERTQLAFAWAREICREFGNAPKFAKASTAGAVERLASSARCFVMTAEAWDNTAWIIGTPGGTVDLRTGNLLTANPADHITRQTHIAPAPAGATPTRWLAFLNDATRGDSALIRFLQQIAGYALTGDTSEHALFFIYGAGGNGKSVFLNTLSGIMDEYAQSAAMDTFTASKQERHPTDLAMLKGSRLVSASETEDGKAWAETRIKGMTGGDPITARFMRMDFFTFQPEFKLFIVGNHKPRLNNVDDATKRRFNIIPFIHKPSQPDSNLERILREEWPAILRWMIDGCLDWQANGLQRPPVVVEATREYFEDQDVFGQWLDEICEQHTRYREANTDLFTSWKRYAEAAGEFAGTAKSFGEAMRKRGFEAYKSGSVRGFKGIRLMPRNQIDDPRTPNDWD